MLLVSIIQTDPSDQFQQISIGMCQDQLQFFSLINPLVVTDEQSQIQATTIEDTENFLENIYILSA